MTQINNLALYLMEIIEMTSNWKSLNVEQLSIVNEKLKYLYNYFELLPPDLIEYTHNQAKMQAFLKERDVLRSKLQKAENLYNIANVEARRAKRGRNNWKSKYRRLNRKYKIDTMFLDYYKQEHTKKVENLIGVEFPKWPKK
jgi:hypothetical protein